MPLCCGSNKHKELLLECRIPGEHGPRPLGSGEGRDTVIKAGLSKGANIGTEVDLGNSCGMDSGTSCSMDSGTSRGMDSGMDLSMGIDMFLGRCELGF